MGAKSSGIAIKRHSAAVRVTHWIVVLCVTILLMSGLQIFNAHPALYSGQQSDFDNPLLSMQARVIDGKPRGITKVFSREFDTTGFLGLSNVDGNPAARGFPPALTIPSEQDLATGRRWHFLFAWIFVGTGLVYLAYGMFASHFRRDLVPTRSEFASIGAEVANHMRLRFPRGDAARRYNILQMLAYLGVIFLLLPLMVLTGASMSPGIDAALHWLPEIFGGRQGARTAHFIIALLLVLFVIIHVVMVLISGPLNNVRSMITGWYRLPPERKSRMTRLDRRKLLAISTLGLSGLASGCDRVVASAPAQQAISWGEWLSYRAQRFLIGADRLAREFSEAEITKNFRANGTTEPQDGSYWKLSQNQFADWKLRVGGLVEQELELSLSDLKSLPSRTQITRHDCVEGWSCIGKWKGTPLAHVLDMARVREDARYAIFYCADTMEGVPPDDDSFEAEAALSIRYYESLDLLDARHPQTILAYEMNDAPLPVAYGAPLRLRVERQLGYKMAKYLMRIELVSDFDKIGEGRGGYWEDRGYDWYAGI